MAVQKPRLRAIGRDERVESARVKSITEAAESGDTLAELVAMRTLNARLMSNPNIAGRDFAALSRRQLEIGREIDAIRARDAQEAEHDVEDGEFDAAAI